MPIGSPTADEELKLAQAGKLEAERNKILDLLPRPSRTGPPSPQEAGIPYQPPRILPHDPRPKIGGPLPPTEINVPAENMSYNKGGPVKYTKGTGAVDIGSWTAPMKSRRGK